MHPLDSSGEHSSEHDDRIPKTPRRVNPGRLYLSGRKICTKCLNLGNRNGELLIASTNFVRIYNTHV